MLDQDGKPVAENIRFQVTCAPIDLKFSKWSRTHLEEVFRCNWQAELNVDGGLYSMGFVESKSS